ncbi:hypothetical protein MYCTH_2107271 [Thermothelomyces thermophilus ATCC 42464]|uniref:Uncharacterized protein n=1 Tax=Thermothelomyces thermophilus (strain ATCC 42464 / BCRC 31852 / DSM 1799) TaxID=573729 RepID=G2Q4Q6_THET4|nr:uncharacterized protein MYCTH_2107271 [Thermothelomyces thermophilus ATCC 42464]AEO54545.1 hypothetical protein MYCTH_2107271 [Thermothelomyces thermophilus ATCC 42464]
MTFPAFHDILWRLRRPDPHLERLRRPVPALARGVDRVLHPRRFLSLDLYAILDEAEDEPLPLYTRWAIDAEFTPPAYAPRPTGPPPSYEDTLRHDLLGTPPVAPSPSSGPGPDHHRHVTFGAGTKQRRPRPPSLQPALARPAGGIGLSQRPPTPRPRSPPPPPRQQQQQQQQQHYLHHHYHHYHHHHRHHHLQQQQQRQRQRQQQEELQLLTPAQRAMRGKWLRVPPKIAGTMRASLAAADNNNTAAGGVTAGFGGV